MQEKIYLSPKLVLSEYQSKYISLIPDGKGLVDALDYSFHELKEVCNTISEEKSLYRYAPEKWTIRTMLMHISDTEKIFLYRALCIARGDENELPGFDENHYAANSNADSINFSAILNECELVALCMKSLFVNLDHLSVHRFGVANKIRISPAIIGFMTAGHRLHHLQILRDRYLL